jgi:hypothetical protein
MYVRDVRRLVAWFFVMACVVPAPASASRLVARGATSVSLQVNGSGEALVSYRVRGAQRNVLVWGGINAMPPRRGRAQVRLQLDYSGGAISRGYAGAGGFRGCGRYVGPRLPYLIAACTASDGSHWALQAWRVQLPDLGFDPWTWIQSNPELHVSHWRGQLAQIKVYADWVYAGRFHRVYGRYTYRGVPIYGFKTDGRVPLDGFGRLVFVDTHNAPAYGGGGWRRENSFLVHQPNGVFCYGFFDRDPRFGGYKLPPGWTGGRRGAGISHRYRISANGPGAMPDVSAQIADPGEFDPDSAAHVARVDASTDFFDRTNDVCHRG